MKQQTRVAMFGLGLMGSGMARRLAAAEFPLSVYNRNADKARALADSGAHVAATPREAAERADVIVSMVADDEASKAMWLGDKGALAGAKRGTIFIECSTLTVKWVRELGKAASAAGCELLDAPVTGSKTHAANGELNFIVGGSAEALEKAKPVLLAMGKSALHLGPTGSGALLKLINNFLCAVQMVSLAEAVALIESSGLDRAKALEVLQNGAPGSPLVKGMPSRMTARDYTPHFQMHLMAKDLKYAIAEGAGNGVDLATAANALKIFEKSIQSGRGDQDFSAVVEQYRNKN